MKQFIGAKKIKLIKETEEKTTGGYPITKIIFEDNNVQYVSDVMFKRVVSDKPCDESELRDKRVGPVVEIVLAVFRDWGIKVGELPYFSALLNKSLEYNSNSALIGLVSGYMPKPNSLDDVDYCTIDRILRNQQITVNNVIKK